MIEDFNDNDEITFHIKQNVQCEIPSIVAVLLLPISMITFANSTTGVFVGIVLLIIIVYGIYNIYKILYGKELYITANKILYRHFNMTKEMNYKEIIQLSSKRGFLNSLCNTETLILQLEDEEISLVNVSELNQIKEYLKTKIKG